MADRDNKTTHHSAAARSVSDGHGGNDAVAVSYADAPAGADQRTAMASAAAPAGTQRPSGGGSAPSSTEPASFDTAGSTSDERKVASAGEATSADAVGVKSGGSTTTAVPGLVPCDGVKALSEAQLKALEGLYPAPLIKLWRAVGWGLFNDGFFYIGDPAQFKEQLVEWLPGSDVSTYHVFARTAWGQLLYYRDLHARALTNGASEEEAASTHDVALCNVLYHECSVLDWDFDHFVWEDLKLGFGSSRLAAELGYPNFIKHRKKLGPPTAKDIYMYVPMLSIGGSVETSQVQLGDAFVHWVLLRQS